MNRRGFLGALGKAAAFVAAGPLLLKIARTPMPIGNPIFEGSSGTIDGLVIKQTNFAALTPSQRAVWSRDVWTAAREESLLQKLYYSGDQGSPIQRVTALQHSPSADTVPFNLIAG